MKIKICGLTREQDIEAVNSAMPDWVGFIIDVPFSKRNLSIDEAAKLTPKLDKNIPSVGVFIDAPVSHVVQAIRDCGFDCVQLHGSENNAYIDEVRCALAESNIDCVIWQAVKIKDEIDIARAAASNADLVLLDGGTGDGRRFAWELTEAIERPFILAGGLTPNSIQDAARFNPIAVDISSGVETDDVKDADKIMAAVKAAHSI